MSLILLKVVWAAVALLNESDTNEAAPSPNLSANLLPPRLISIPLSFFCSRKSLNFGFFSAYSNSSIKIRKFIYL